MANQADRGGVQQLIKKWRNWPIVSYLQGAADVESGPSMFERAARRKCADELEAALQGSVASPQVCPHCELPPVLPDVCTPEINAVIERNIARDWDLYDAGREAGIKLAGSGATTPAPRWELIETAPKFKAVLVFYDDYGEQITARKGERGTWTVAGLSETYSIQEPSHWTPLPDPPSTAERSQEDQHRKKED